MKPKSGLPGIRGAGENIYAFGHNHGFSWGPLIKELDSSRSSEGYQEYPQHVRRFSEHGRLEKEPKRKNDAQQVVNDDGHKPSFVEAEPEVPRKKRAGE